MAHKKAGGSTKNLRDSNPKYLGVKLADGSEARAGSIIVRQRGTVFTPGSGTAIGKDHTIFAKIEGKVSFRDKRKVDFTGKTKTVSEVSVSA